MQIQQTNRATELLLKTIGRSDTNPEAVRSAAAFFARNGNYPELRIALQKITIIEPKVPETWYDLARLEIIQGQKEEAIKDLQTSIRLSDQRLKQDPQARNIRSAVQTNIADFAVIRDSADFQKLVAP